MPSTLSSSSATSPNAPSCFCRDHQCCDRVQVNCRLKTARSTLMSAHDHNEDGYVVLAKDRESGLQ